MPPTGFLHCLPAEPYTLTSHANSFASQGRCIAHRQRCAVNAKHRPAPSRQPVWAQAAKEAHIPAVTPVPETPTWDPEGLLSRVPASGGHFARRERKQ